MFDFIKKLFSESGEASFGRICSFLCLIAGIAWASYIVCKNAVIPDLTGVIAFISAPYTIGKINETVQKFSGGDKV